MLRITIEFLPRGSEVNKQVLGVAEVWNDGSGNSEVGNYKARILKKGQSTQTWKGGSIQGFRRNKFGPWDLLALCLLAALGEKRLSRAIERPP